MEVAEFIKCNPTCNRKKLRNSAHDIEILTDAGYSLREIQEYLASKGIIVTIPAISYQRRIVIPRIKAARKNSKHGKTG